MFDNILESDRLRLRPLEMSDLDTLYTWENDSSVWLVSGTTVPFSRELLTQYIQSAEQDIYAVRQLRLIIETKDDNPRSVGAIDLFDFDPMNQRVGVGILIDPQSRGNGFAKEALQIMNNYASKLLGVHQLYCNITEDNSASLKAFQDVGYTIAGTKKDWIRTPNGWLDEHLLQIVF